MNITGEHDRLTDFYSLGDDDERKMDIRNPEDFLRPKLKI